MLHAVTLQKSYIMLCGSRLGSLDTIMGIEGNVSALNSADNDPVIAQGRLAVSMWTCMKRGGRESCFRNIKHRYLGPGANNDIVGKGWVALAGLLSGAPKCYSLHIKHSFAFPSMFIPLTSLKMLAYFSE